MWLPLQFIVFTAGLPCAGERQKEEAPAFLEVTSEKYHTTINSNTIHHE